MLVVKNKKQSQVNIKKSKFLGFAFCVQSEPEVKNILTELQKEYKDAKHLVYAYRFLNNGSLKERFYNDKEPTNSAGKPLLYLLQQKEVINCLLIVVRYFGGIKLGVGGLRRAYTTTGQEVLENNLINYDRAKEN